MTINKPSPHRKRGRPFGAKNQAGESIRWGIVEAYRQLGGVDGLVQWGRKNPDMFYPMLTKLLPAELAESGHGQGITVIVQRSTEGVKTKENSLVILPPQDQGGACSAGGGGS